MSGRYGPLKLPIPGLIGTQIWTLINLDVTTYRNGDTIEQVTDGATWAALTTGAWCWYNNNSANGAIYGRLYNWYAVNDPRGLAPIGYHIPSNTEWGTLRSYLGGQLVAGGPLKETGTTHWNSPNTGATNSTGWTGLGSGYRASGDGTFEELRISAFFWSSTEVNASTANVSTLDYSSPYLLGGTGGPDKKLGASVRCLKD
jgi:uncharacterized protein (TIGR02145 family)